MQLKRLKWDSRWVGVASGQIVPDLLLPSDYEARKAQYCRELDELLQAAELQEIEFLSARSPESDVALIHSLENNGFRLIETHLTLSRDLLDNYTPQAQCFYPVLRATGCGWMDICGDIADAAFKHSRLYVDPRIDADAARRHRREWVRNNFNGRAEITYVAASDKCIPVGFIQLRAGTIDLLAVHPGYQYRKCGMALVEKAITYYQAKHSQQILKVSTQAKNFPAVSLYTRLGFRIDASNLTFHRWS